MRHRALAAIPLLLSVVGCDERNMTDETELPHSTILAQSLEELGLKTARFERLFQIGAADWEVDQDSSLITFTSPDGIVASAPVQIVGTYNTADGTWLWAWGNSSVLPTLSAHARLVQEYGERRGIEQLTSRKLEVDEQKAWEFTALTCKLGGFQGAYRGPAGQTMVFFTFGEIQLKRQE